MSGFAFGEFAMSELDSKQKDEFMIARARAVENYARVEQSLCSVVAAMLEVPRSYAGVILFKITAARARNGIVDALVKKRKGSEFNLFMNSVLKLLGQIDERRNQIVHWHQVLHATRNSDGEQVNSWWLTPPNFHDATQSTPKIAKEDMEEFSMKCDFIARSLSIFETVINQDLDVPDEIRRSWHEICRQPLTYPPPDTHPLSRNYKEP